MLSVASQVAQLALPLDLNATDALRHHGLVEKRAPYNESDVVIE